MTDIIRKIKKDNKIEYYYNDVLMCIFNEKNPFKTYMWYIEEQLDEQIEYDDDVEFIYEDN